MADKNTGKEKSGSSVFKTLWRWIKRMFCGASKELSQEDIFAVEKLESPSKLAVKAFFRRKLAVVALVVLVLLFMLVFIGPLFFPMELSFNDANQANIAPTMSMRSVPSGMKDNIKSIHGYANFTLGVSNDNTLYVWGSAKDSLSKLDYSEFPEEIKEGNVIAAATGRDHVIAITTDGRVIGWGNSDLGQYGAYKGNAENDNITEMPAELVNGTIDASKVQSLECGYQATALVVDGKAYIWGNKNTCKNLKNYEESMDEFSKGVEKICFTNYYAFALMSNGTVKCPGGYFGSVKVTENGERVKLAKYLKKHKVVDITATKNCFVFLMEDGQVLVAGSAESGENEIPDAVKSEKIVSIAGGSQHVVAVGESGRVYAWGSNFYGQCDVDGMTASKVYAGAYQTYAVDENGKLLGSAGLAGYPFGTDGNGRDTLTRIIHGGKMTMTIGAVAVIVSSIIAVIVGCLSGYFGGLVDMVLMRVTEIFSAIPFLPFAMMLSYIFTKKPIDENTKIFIIMVILGLLSWTGLARMIRGQVLAEREKEFVISAKAMGVREKRIAFKHILPNVVSVILVSMTLDFAGCLLTESSLSYLGFGVQLPRPTWGNMLNGANNSVVIQNYWWQWLFPALFLSIATICINIIGDTLRDVLDPKSSQEK